AKKCPATGQLSTDCPARYSHTTDGLEPASQEDGLADCYAVQQQCRAVSFRDPRIIAHQLPADLRADEADAPFRDKRDRLPLYFDRAEERAPTNGHSVRNERKPVRIDEAATATKEFSPNLGTN